MSYRTLVPLALAGAIACSTSPAAPAPQPEGTALDSVIFSTRARYHLPGLAAMVLHADSIEVMGTVGVRRLGRPAPLTTADRFHLGSNMKAMTATMLATLVAEGKLSWDTRPVDVFPELAASIHPDHRDITLAQLLSHRAGIEPLTNFADVPPLTGTPMEQRAQGAALLLALPSAVPADSFLYSNGGYGIAAAMAERVTGQPWETLMQERLLATLGMTLTFTWPAAGTPDEPWGHEPVGKAFRPYDPGQFPDPRRIPTAIAPAGEGSATLAEYARFVQLHLRGLMGQPTFLDAGSFARLHTPTGIYALGWGEISLDGVPTATHEGSTGTFYATVFIQPTRNLAVVVVTNAGGDEAGRGVTDAALQLLARYGASGPRP